MNSWRSCLALGVVLYATAKGFDYLITSRPGGLFWDMSYYGFAASVDCIMFHLAPLFVSGKLRRDIQALTIASLVTNAFGFALYMAYSPPSIYNWIIQGINYVLAIRLIYTGGGDVFNNFDWSRLVRGSVLRRSSHSIKEGN